MNDNIRKKKLPQEELDQYSQNLRRLAAYMKTAMWDEKMNVIREFWLWERNTPSKRNHKIN
jgi:hypothetical protein